MKKIFKNIISTGLILVLLYSCETEEVNTFDNKTDYAFFQSDSVLFPYFIKPSSIKIDTVNIKINLLGKFTASDREIKVKLDSASAVEGIDFSVIRPVIMKKDSVEANLKVILFRTPEIAVKTKSIYFSLQESADFLKPNYPGKTSFKLKFSDKIEKPDWWPWYFYNFPYSLTRMQFYIDVMGSAEAPNVQYPSNGFYYTIYKLKAGLSEYNKSHAEPLSDEFGIIKWDISEY